MKNKQMGKCSICGKEAELSEDHIPPKCCGNNSDTYYIQYLPEFLTVEGGAKPVHSQNGLKFRNICHKCNNEMGSKYDNELRIFRDVIISIIDGKRLNYSFELEKVCKSVIGHFLAAASFDTSLYGKDMRDYYLYDNKKIYNKYSLLCAYYPYQKNIFSLNDYVVANLCNDNIPEGMISSLYFYPFAFIFCKKQHPPFGSDIFEMCINRCLMLRINSNDWYGKPPNWPANIDDGHAVMAGATFNDSKFKIK